MLCPSPTFLRSHLPSFMEAAACGICLKREAAVSAGAGGHGAHVRPPILPRAHLAKHRIIPQVSSAALRLFPVGVLGMESGVTGVSPPG